MVRCYEQRTILKSSNLQILKSSNTRILNHSLLNARTGFTKAARIR